MSNIFRRLRDRSSFADVKTARNVASMALQIYCHTHVQFNDDRPHGQTVTSRYEQQHTCHIVTNIMWARLKAYSIYVVEFQTEKRCRQVLLNVSMSATHGVAVLSVLFYIRLIFTASVVRSMFSGTCNCEKCILQCRLT